MILKAFATASLAIAIQAYYPDSRERENIKSNASYPDAHGPDYILMTAQKK